MADMTPSGSQVVQSGVAGLGDFFKQLGGIAVTGISRRVDLEFPSQPITPDTAEVARDKQAPVDPPGLGSVLTNLTPIQLGGLAVAGALTFALLTGRFR